MSDDARKIVKRVDTWLGEAIIRERYGEKVFTSTKPNKAVLTAGICDTSERNVYRIRHDTPQEEIKIPVNKGGRPRIQVR